MSWQESAPPAANATVRLPLTRAALRYLEETSRAAWQRPKALAVRSNRALPHRSALLGVTRLDSERSSTFPIVLESAAAVILLNAWARARTLHQKFFRFNRVREDESMYRPCSAAGEQRSMISESMNVRTVSKIATAAVNWTAGQFAAATKTSGPTSDVRIADRRAPRRIQGGTNATKGTPPWYRP